jgi:uncharacterized membrane protein
MENIIVAVFKSEGEAYEGARALRQLDAEGIITINEAAVIHKNENGKVKIRDNTAGAPAGTAVGTATGTVVGALIGALTGPVGAAVGGAVAGTLAGGATVGVSRDYLKDVSQTLAPGTTAVVADIIEGAPIPVDAHMNQLGGTVLRHPA